MTKILRIAGISVAGVACGLLIGLLLVAAVATQLLNYKVLTVQSDSMRPEFKRGDVLVIRPVDVGKVSEGDVVAFESESGEALIAHRVVGINRFILNLTDSRTGETGTSTQYQFQTKGDANPSADSTFVEGRQVVGSVWFELPDIGMGFGSVGLQTALFALAGLLAVSWISWEIYTKLGRSSEQGETASS
jgi:signal peptidase